MKRIILGIACMAALGVGSMNAQNNNCAPANCNQTQCVPAANCNQTQCIPANCDYNRGRNCPFANLNLTDAQKQQLQSLNQKYDAQKSELKKDNKTRNEAAKTEFRKQAKQMQEQRLADIKKILTPEQYTLYLENCYMTGNHKAKAVRKVDARGNRCHDLHKGSKGGRHLNAACYNNGEFKKDVKKQDKKK